MAKKEVDNSIEINLSDEWINTLKTFVSIGSRDPYGSFVLIKKDKMKVMHESTTIMAEYSYPEINIDKTISVFDASKLLAIIQMFKNSGKPYSFEFVNNYQLMIKSGRNRVNLYLTKSKEVGSRKEAGSNDKNAEIKDFVVLTDENFNERINFIKEDKIAEFTITKDDLKRIEDFQKIMKVSNKLFSIAKGEDNNIKFVISQDAIQQNPDAASFEIESDFNKMTDDMEFAVQISGKMKDIESRNYKAFLSSTGLMYLESLDDSLRYMIATQDMREENLKNIDNNEEDEDFKFEEN